MTEKFRVIPVNDQVDEVIDVFFETGWDIWTRFAVKRAKGKVFLTKVAGRPLSDSRYKTLCEALI